MMHANVFATTTSRVELTARGDVREYTEVEGGYQSLLERDVVIRRLRPEAAAAPRTRARFIKEIQTLAALHHHNFIRVFDAGLADDCPFAVFERLHGVTAQDRLDRLADRGARMSIDEAVRIVRGVADGVAYARRHGANVYDLTPANIMLANDQRVVLTSLGQALPDNPLTAPAAVLAYTPPERLFGEPAEGDSEVYSLGVLLAHLVFGRMPYEGNAIAIIAQKQQLSNLPLLEDPHHSLACPYPLAAVMHRATAYEPAERYPSADVFRTALLDVLNRHPYKTHSLQAPPSRLHARAFGEERPVAQAARYAAPADFAAVELYDEQAVFGAPVARAPLATPEPRAPLGPSAVAAAAPAVVRAPAAQPAVQQVGPTIAYEAPSPVMVAAAVPEALDGEVIAGPLPYDPLMPGLNDETLQAALPFTILVPMPPEAEAPPEAEGAAPRRGGLSAQHMLVVMALTLFLVISTAFMVG